MRIYFFLGNYFIIRKLQLGKQLVAKLGKIVFPFHRDYHLNEIDVQNKEDIYSMIFKK